MHDFDESHSEAKVQEVFEKRRSEIISVEEEREINASGHKDQLQRQYSLWGVCGLALTIDNAWVALGGSITIAICKFRCASPGRTLVLCLQLCRQRRTSWHPLRASDGMRILRSDSSVHR